MDSHKFLILRLSAVGDVIRTLPAVKALKAYYPSSYIAWVVEEPSKDLLESQPEIDQIILFPRKKWMEGIRSPIRIGKTLGEIQEFILSLRRAEFDIVLDFHGILKSGVISILSGCPKRIGFDQRASKEGNFFFSNVKVSLPDEKISRFERNYKLLQGIGLEVKNFHPTLDIPEKDREYVESFLNALSTPLQRPCIAIHAGTSLKTLYKRWSPDQYSQLADRLIQELRATVIFTWGPREVEWVEGIRKKMKEPSVLSPPTESLTQLGEVFRQCDLYIGGDTGPMHIASLVGTPVVVIYGPTDPKVNEPFGLHQKVMKEVGCNPCRNRSCQELSCLKAVTVEDVFKAAKEILFLTP